MKLQTGSDKNSLNSIKKAYSEPRVAYYGHVAKITRGSSRGQTDGMSGTSKACWIAEVLYGIEAPRTQLVRAWLKGSYERGDLTARVVVPLYSRFGMALAAFLRRRPTFQAIFRPLFDLAIKRAHREYAEWLVLASHFSEA